MNRTYCVLNRVVIGCILLMLGTATAQAQQNRYPTESELNRLKQQFHRKIQKMQGERLYLDRRTSEEKRSIRAFRTAWSKVNPTVAPYLGEWRAIEESKSIFPSQQPGQVCIVDTYLRESSTEPTVFLTVAQVVAGQIQAKDGILLPQGDFLGLAFINTANHPEVYPYAYPAPLQTPDPQILREFAQAGCTIELPDLSSIRLEGNI